MSNEESVEVESFTSYCSAILLTNDLVVIGHHCLLHFLINISIFFHTQTKYDKLERSVPAIYDGGTQESKRYCLYNCNKFSPSTNFEAKSNDVLK